MLIARHKVIRKISFEIQIAVGHESQISLISIWLSLSVKQIGSLPSLTLYVGMLIGKLPLYQVWGHYCSEPFIF